MKRPNIGALRHRIEIRKDSRESDHAGGLVESEPKTIACVWAKIDGLHGREFWQAQQVSAEVTHRVTMRYLDGISRDQYVWYQGRRLDIVYILNVGEKNAYLELMTTERP